MSFNYEQKTDGTSYDHRVGEKVQQYVDEGYKEIFVTKMEDGWEIVARKPFDDEKDKCIICGAELDECYNSISECMRDNICDNCEVPK